MGKAYRSPDTRYRVALDYEGEIRFGPAYFRISIDGRQVPDRLCGDKLFWSPDSKYLAVEEWLTTEESDGPVTRVLLIDLDTMRMAALGTIERGFVRNVRFTDRGLSYIEEFPGTGHVSRADVDYSAITDWSTIGS